MFLIAHPQYPSSSSVFSLFVVGALSFQSPLSPVLCFFYLYLFLLHVFSDNITSFGLPVFRCPPTSMFSLLHLALSFSPHVLTISVFHVLITTSSSVFLSTWPNHISLPCSHTTSSSVFLSTWPNHLSLPCSHTTSSSVFLSTWPNHLSLPCSHTTSSSVFLSTWPNHLSLPCSHYYIFFSLSLNMA